MQRYRVRERGFERLPPFFKPALFDLDAEVVMYLEDNSISLGIENPKPAVGDSCNGGLSLEGEGNSVCMGISDFTHEETASPKY